MKEKCCGNCKYSERDWTNPNNPDFYCSNVELRIQHGIYAQLRRF